MLIPLLALAAVANTAAADTMVYPVYNHDRVAGSMIVARHGDTVTVRYIYTDRNRGTRIEMRYLMHGDSAIWMERRPVLPNDQLGESDEPARSSWGFGSPNGGHANHY